MRIVQLGSEGTPFAKTGGLADVCAALPRQFKARGHDVISFLPFYSAVPHDPHPIRPVSGMEKLAIDLGGRRYSVGLFETRWPSSEAPLFLVDCPMLYHRSGIYSSDPDEGVRFVVLCHAALMACQRWGFSPDVVHAHDWQAALTPLLLKTSYAWDRLFRRTKSVLTIHNLGYQGVFPASIVSALGLPKDATHLLHQEQLTAGSVNLLLTGILYADLISTVSPTYAKEITSPEHGVGLDPFLRARSKALIGILNGVDDDWNPATDRYLARPYDSKTVFEAKPINRARLLEAIRRPAAGPATPVIGIVSRLTAQKGFDLLFDLLPPLLAHRDIRLVVLGSGEARYEQFFAKLEQQFGEKVCFYRGFQNELAHLIEAGSDIFLMPSRFEPCGLNQMYSQRYGTVPVVRRTGGLADSVLPWNPVSGSGTGFLFEPYSAAALWGALRWALETYQDRAAWQRLMLNGMSVDFSWNSRAERYLELFEAVTARFDRAAEG